MTEKSTREDSFIHSFGSVTRAGDETTPPSLSIASMSTVSFETPRSTGDGGREDDDGCEDWTPGRAGTTPPPRGNGDATGNDGLAPRTPDPDRRGRGRGRARASDRFVPSRKTSVGFRGGFSLLEAASGEGEGTRARDAEARGGERGGERGDARGTPREGEEDDPRRGRDVDDDGRWMNGRTGTGATATTTGGAAAGSRGYEREDASVAYGALLRSELFGDVSPPEAYGVTPPASPTSSRYRARRVVVSPIDGSSYSRASPGRNLFRFRDDGVLASTATTTSPYELNPAGGVDGPLGMTLSSPRRRVPRKIPRSPYKVLDAPALQDDFYLNLVDWSASNVLAVGLGTCVYLWSACTSKVTKLCELDPDDSVCSVAWTQRGTYLGIGTNSGEVQIWDVAKAKKTRAMLGHRGRAGTLAWNSHTLSSGSRDRTILNRDIRSPSDYSNKLLGHKSEVCGLKWSYDDQQLASGGNDNQLFVWNAHSSSPALRCGEHTAAVKAIAWSPHQQGLLASGGGTADRCIRFWNTVTNAPLQCVDTGSQVCNLVWSKNVNEIVSTHGYSQNQIVVWRYPSMSKLTTLTGHTFRVLFLAISPDGQTIVTGAGDETLRFWNVFPGLKSQTSGAGDNTVATLARTSIR